MARLIFLFSFVYSNRQIYQIFRVPWISILHENLIQPLPCTISNIFLQCWCLESAAVFPTNSDICGYE